MTRSYDIGDDPNADTLDSPEAAEIFGVSDNEDDDGTRYALRGRPTRTTELLEMSGSDMAGPPVTGGPGLLVETASDLLRIGANSIDALLTALLPDRGNGDPELEAERDSYARPYERLAARMRGTADGMEVVEQWTADVTLPDLSAVRHAVTWVRGRVRWLVTTPLWWIVEASDGLSRWLQSVLTRDDVDDYS